MANREVLARELQHHEEIYSGFAQSHFAKPGVRAFRHHSARRILQTTGAGADSRVLSLGCGIGDTELLLAPRVGHITGIDLSPSAIRQAQADADAAGAGNVEFIEGDLDSAVFEPASFDAIFAIFLLHHIDDDALERLASRIADLLRPGGVFYALDPSRYRLSGAIGKLLVPHLMEQHQSPDERELRPAEVRAMFRSAALETSTRFYDFTSTPVAGLFPARPSLYRFSRALDEVLIRIPLLRNLGSNFELIATRI
jgi:SAM-dependent methyltransferase